MELTTARVNGEVEAGIDDDIVEYLRRVVRSTVFIRRAINSLSYSQIMKLRYEHGRSMYSDSQSGKRGKLFAKPQIMWLVAVSPATSITPIHGDIITKLHKFKFIFSRKEKRNKSPNPFSSPCPIELSALCSPFHSLDVIDSPKPI